MNGSTKSRFRPCLLAPAKRQPGRVLPLDGVAHGVAAKQHAERRVEPDHRARDPHGGVVLLLEVGAIGGRHDLQDSHGFLL